MVKAIAARWRRGGSRVGLSVALGVAWPLTLLAQGEAAKKAEAPEAKAAAPKADKPGDAKAAKADEAAPAPVSRVNPGGDIFHDARAEKLIEDLENFKPIKSVALPKGADEQVMNWAGGVPAPDKNVIDAYIRKQAADMTSAKVIGLLASKKPADNEAGILLVEQSFERLLTPVTKAMKSTPPRRDFVSIYTQFLLKVMPELLSNHLYARLEGMIVLSRTADPQAIDTFVKQLADRDQDVLVKQIAAYGLTNVVKNSREPLPPAVSIPAAEALVGFLEGEPEVIWTARYRALEALGWLRQATRNPLAKQYPMIDAAAKILANPEERLEVRAWAAWAIGMMRVDDGNAPIRYSAIAGDVAKLAIELGDKILAVKSNQQSEQAHELITLLAWPIYNSLKGEPGQNRSGLVNAAALDQDKASAFVKGLEPLVQAEARAAVELGRSAGAQLHTQWSKELAGTVQALKAFVAQNPPAPLAKPAEGPSPKAAAGARVDAVGAR